MSDGDEEDWFERAIQDDESTAESEADADEGTAATADDAESTRNADETERDRNADDTADPDIPEVDDEATNGREAPPTGAFGGESDEGADVIDTDPSADAGPDAETADANSTGGVGDDDPFAEDFGSAFQRAPDPEGVPGDNGQGDAPGGDDFDFGDLEGGPEPESFDEDAFESSIERVDIGIEGLDEMILGGVPDRSLIVAVGSAGTGKTTFGMQFLHTALERGDNAVYISLEEDRERILSTADEKGWDFSGYEEEEEQLAVVDFDPVEMTNSLSSIQNDLPRLIDEFDADRLVLDSVSLLEMMYDSPSQRRTEVFEFSKSLKESGVTTFVTSEASESNPYASRYGIIEYLADAVFVLQYVRPSDFRETRLAVEIQKIRDANHSRETKPYEITGDGISVYRQANIF